MQANQRTQSITGCLFSGHDVHGVPCRPLDVLLFDLLHVRLQVAGVLASHGTGAPSATQARRKDRARRTSSGFVHCSLGSAVWRMLSCEARLKRKARSYASLGVRRWIACVRGTRTAVSLEEDGKARGGECSPAGHPRAPRPLARGGGRRALDARRGGRWAGARTEVVVFEAHLPVAGEVGVPGRDGLEPPGEGAGRAHVRREGDTEGAEEGHRYKLEWWCGVAENQRLASQAHPIRAFPAPPRSIWLLFGHRHAPGYHRDTDGRDICLLKIALRDRFPLPILSSPLPLPLTSIAMSVQERTYIMVKVRLFFFFSPASGSPS